MSPKNPQNDIEFGRRIALKTIGAASLIGLAGPAAAKKNGSQGKPIKWWCPDIDEYFTKYYITVAPGQSGTDLMAIESQTELENVELWISGDIEPYLSFDPDTFEILKHAGRKTVTGEVERKTVTGKIEMPSDEKVGSTYDGTVHIRSAGRNKRTYPRVLKVTIKVVAEDSDQLDAGDPLWKRPD